MGPFGMQDANITRASLHRFRPAVFKVLIDAFVEPAA